jgi:hypothetical protein
MDGNTTIDAQTQNIPTGEKSLNDAHAIRAMVKVSPAPVHQFFFISSSILYPAPVTDKTYLCLAHRDSIRRGRPCRKRRACTCAIPMPVFMLCSCSRAHYVEALRQGNHTTVHSRTVCTSSVMRGWHTGWDSREQCCRWGSSRDRCKTPNNSARSTMIVQLFIDVDAMESGPRFDGCKVNLPQINAYTSASPAANVARPLTSDLPHPHTRRPLARGRYH